MKNAFVLFLITLVFPLHSASSRELYGSWVKTKVEYFDKGPLPDANALKFEYLRYTFEKPNILLMSLVFDDRGTVLSFSLINNTLEVKNNFGFAINHFRIEQLTDTMLVLVQKGRAGFTENDCVRFYFTTEELYQSRLPIRPSDIFQISKGDTIFKACEKVYPKFVGDQSFYEFCSENMPEKKAISATNNFFLATFIIRKTGAIDSVRVLEGINERFTRQFMKALNRSQRFWKAAELDNRKVDVQTKMTFQFISSLSFLPVYDFSQKGKNAMNQSDFSSALYYFNLVLEKRPDDYETLFSRAICELKLGNKVAACADLKKVSESGKLRVDELMMKECK